MKARHVRDAVRTHRDALHELALDLVSVPSVTGSENDAQDLLAERLGAWGLDIDLWTVEPAIQSHPAYCDDGLPVERKNLVARWGDEGVPAALILNGHIDVVPPGERTQWLDDPFHARIHDGALHGRGACDMKGGLAACCVAVKVAMSLGVTPKRPILIQSVIGEETGGLGTLAAIERGYRADGAVIAEPTSLDLCPVQAGALSFRLHVGGKAAHGAMRQEGVSAIEKFWPVFRALESLEERRHTGFRHPMYPDGSLVAPISIGTVQAGNWPSTVPEELIASGRYGIFPREEVVEARRSLEDAVRASAEADPWFRDHPVRVEWFEGQFESGETAADAPLLQELSRCHEELAGAAPHTHGVSYGSDLRLFTRHAGIPAVLYGPGDVALAHTANEWLPIEELERAVEIYTLLITHELDA